MQGIFTKDDFPDLIAGLEEPDDAAVWKLNEQTGLVATTDFFTPIVDDPYTYGQIAAANSLSDIYAMGGRPFMALNIAAFPPQLSPEILSEIMRGGAEKAREAGVVIAGGHTIQDKEPKYGLIALGYVQLEHILRKGGMHPGDILFLSKPLGSGIISSAIKADRIPPEDTTGTIKWMTRLNAKAAELALRFGAHAATDITGFSLLGHGWEMAAASRVGIQFHFESLPFYLKAKQLANEWCFPGGSFDNAEYYQEHVSFAEGMRQEDELLLFDPQTSGGLLFALPSENARQCEVDSRKQGIPLWQVGVVTDSGQIEII